MKFLVVINHTEQRRAIMEQSIQDKIMLCLQTVLEPLDYIYALWLEGADANGTTDEYSDMDIYVDVEDSMEEQAWEKIEMALIQIAEIDYRYVCHHGHPKLRQNVYHLKGTSEYLMIDFNMQMHSRNKDEFIYKIGDQIEAAKITFDKADVITYRAYNPEEDASFFKGSIEESKYRYSQHCRVKKYILRGQMPEAYIYYNRYVIEPLVTLLRIKYTPAHVDYYMIHITHHLPQKELMRLNALVEGISLVNMEMSIKDAEQWFTELLMDSEIIRWIS